MEDTMPAHYDAVDALCDDLIAKHGDDWHDMSIADIASAALGILADWSVEARMAAMGMEQCWSPAGDWGEPPRPLGRWKEARHGR